MSNSTMDVIETSPSPSTAPAPQRSGSWGAIISILLILAVVVVGAYFALTARVGNSAAQVAPSGY